MVILEENNWILSGSLIINDYYIIHKNCNKYVNNDAITTIYEQSKLLYRCNKCWKEAPESFQFLIKVVKLFSKSYV